MLWTASLCTETWAQISPKERDRTYKQGAPSRFDERFKKPSLPKSTVVPEKPEMLQPLFPADLKEVRFVLKTVTVRGSTVFPPSRFAPYYKRFVGEQVTLEEIYRIASDITTLYRNDGYILSQAVVPPQSIENGSVRLDIVEGYVDQVTVKGRVRGPKRLLNAYRKKILQSRPLRAADLERYLLLVEDLPGVVVKSVLTPSEAETGASRLTLILENKPFEGQVGLDNRGSEFNGPLEFFGGVTANSLFGLYERTGLHGVVASETDELLYFRIFHEEPVSTEGTRLFLSGSFSQSEPGSSLRPFNVEGDSHTVTARLSHPFIRSRGQNLTGHLGFALLNATTDILGTRDSEDRLRVLEVGGSYDFADRLQGVNLVSLRVNQGLNIFNATETGSPNLSRASGRSDFTKVTGEVVRLQRLAPSWALLAAMTGQYSFHKLLASEEFGFGGPRFGRAYDSSEITGDQGVAFKLEIQRVFEPLKPFLKQFQAYVFFDFGSVWNRVATASGSTQNDRSSAGGGVRFNLTDWLSGYVEVAQPLSDKVAGQGNRDPRLFFSLAARF